MLNEIQRTQPFLLYSWGLVFSLLFYLILFRKNKNTESVLSFLTTIFDFHSVPRMAEEYRGQKTILFFQSVYFFFWFSFSFTLMLFFPGASHFSGKGPGEWVGVMLLLFGVSVYHILIVALYEWSLNLENFFSENMIISAQTRSLLAYIILATMVIYFIVPVHYPVFILSSVLCGFILLLSEVKKGIFFTGIKKFPYVVYISYLCIAILIPGVFLIYKLWG